MKNLFLFFVTISVLFAIGCQDSTITDPLVNESTEVLGVTIVTADKNHSLDYKDYPDIIKFQRVLNLSNSPNSYFVVGGTIKVNHQIQSPNADPLNGVYRVTVSLKMNAQMKELENHKDLFWYIRGNTQNTVYLAKGESTSQVNYYKIKGRCDGMLLACKFEFTLDGVALQGMWITFSNVLSANCVAH